jgi:hypothetical protein
VKMGRQVSAKAQAKPRELLVIHRFG